MDVDVLAAGAAAVNGHRDYDAFWAYLLAVTRELHQNSADVVWCGICRPEQLAEQPWESLGAFSAIEMLVLSCEEDTYLDRLHRRPGGGRAAGRAAFHAALNTDLRNARSVGRVRISHLDTTALTTHETQCRSWAWLSERLVVSAS